ncbi:MAG: hypothetical protein GTO18_07000 [Anaerolineales bacterium]|nr:hypothetical protein [Anaerolineales bacterium]
MEDMLQKIRASGYRLTDARQSVVQVMAAAEDWLSPEDIHARARAYCDSIGLVTVYRTLSLLLDLGCVRRIHFESGCHGYAKSEMLHGHHLVCRGCNQTVEFSGSEDISPLIDQVSNATGFIVEDHMLELLGLCPDCQDQPL